MNLDRAKKIAAQYDADLSHNMARAAHEADNVVEISKLRNAVSGLRKFAHAANGLSDDELRGLWRAASRGAPEAFGTMILSLANAIKLAKNVAEQRPYSADFHSAMAALGERGIDATLVIQTMRLWHTLCANANPPEPTVEQTNDGGMRFAWNDGHLYLDAQIYGDGTTEWFVKNFDTDERDGTEEDRETELPQRFFDMLRKLRKRA